MNVKVLFKASSICFQKYPIFAKSFKMPFKAPESPKCPKCGRSVYAAEEKVAGGLKWHKACFKCETCNKLLDSTTCAEHDKKLYCKTCHGRHYGPKGYGFGAGAGTLMMNSSGGPVQEEPQMAFNNGASLSQAPEGEGCPRCGAYVYHADQVFSKGRAWHKFCFKCSACSRVLDSLTACDGPDKNIYCKVCYRKSYGIQGYGFGQGGPALLTGDMAENGNNPKKSQGVDTTSIPAKSGEGCPRCEGKVFHAEQMFSKGKIYHKKCFSYGEIYCKGCYGKNYGAKGYGYGGGAGVLQCADVDSRSNDRPNLCTNTAIITGTGKDACPRCGGQVFHAEKMLSKRNTFHKSCFSCFECRRPLDSTCCCDAPEGEIFCKQCYGKNFGPKGYGYGGTGSVPALMAPSTVGDFNGERIQTDFHPQGQMTKGTDGDGCPRCGHSVYEAEKILGAQKCWHKRCFTCAVCNRHLDSFTVNDGPDGNIYCHSDYSAKFGVRGYGFGGGAGALQTEGSNMSQIKTRSIPCVSKLFKINPVIKGNHSNESGSSFTFALASDYAFDCRIFPFHPACRGHILANGLPSLHCLIAGFESLKSGKEGRKSMTLNREFINELINICFLAEELKKSNFILRGKNEFQHLKYIFSLWKSVLQI
ncbi:Cysteine and glycine-rich protein 3,Cysteine and glycine-rich protein 2,Cysteine and glycine-rich protein 1,Muscle LIM protein Mlp84B [Lepeophtheirus salmonis]|uniref:Cysteine and glycine-rich protein 3,Cysteine and glycine-rich protein 2,Cysteine and glycine-rich protein 1,Muscle LIM protein Mlp84B n=1 Tax=Lepeophtheirus salmonis TaxID=72036 RepID=A0A7R8HA58_LEPSM|nr:Cysteine and glycine-rich protein 3,Cysteine and glycine-rich protein 2,Cysteine and glycine-rich protein 1,Muscle LIM protein Mlp84B [Lepeophtheirus salmonis]CAF2951562.1 Cysteine and glycine-rich protein 3,Cysteine and glycine-rich protein 2,Cysteine and glycine-rich protein 1,Muscle LIM protein Mlp84B [Lepeophtheirus salmonis]